MDEREPANVVVAEDVNAGAAIACCAPLFIASK
jgi:hypothetical protein